MYKMARKSRPTKKNKTTKESNGMVKVLSEMPRQDELLKFSAVDKKKFKRTSTISAAAKNRILLMRRMGSRKINVRGKARIRRVIKCQVGQKWGISIRQKYQVIQRG